MFKARWQERCKEIKAQSFSKQQCGIIEHQFVTEIGLADVLHRWHLSAVDIIALQCDLTLVVAGVEHSLRPIIASQLPAHNRDVKRRFLSVVLHLESEWSSATVFHPVEAKTGRSQQWPLRQSEDTRQYRSHRDTGPSKTRRRQRAHQQPRCRSHAAVIGASWNGR